MSVELKIAVDIHKKEVIISEPNDIEFAELMMACEYLLHKTAQRSKAGYEKALELLVKVL